jgi:hypothetical protein
MPNEDPIEETQESPETTPEDNENEDTPESNIDGEDEDEGDPDIIPDDEYEVGENEPPMEVIKNGNDRAIKTASTLFLRFVSKDGADEYPTVILLANRIFLQDENRGGEHIGITEKIALQDDFYWYKTSGGIKGIQARMAQLAKENSIFSGLNDGSHEDAEPLEEGNFNSNDGLPGTNFFKKTESPAGITQFYHSKTGYYIKRNGSLYFSKDSPVDGGGELINFPGNGSDTDSPENLLMVYTISPSVDLILTKTHLYRYYIESQFIEGILTFQAEATCFCQLQDYFIVSTLHGLYLINNIDEDEDVLSYEIITHRVYGTYGETSDGLASNNQFTYCFPRGGNVVEVNGEGSQSCQYNCDTRRGSASGRSNVIKVCYDANEPLLIAANSSYDTKGNGYNVRDVLGFAYSERYIYFCQYYEETRWKLVDNVNVPYTVYHRNLIVYRNGVKNTAIIFHIPYTIINCYLDGQFIYLLDSRGNVYKSSIEEDAGNMKIYPVSFKYKEWRKAGEPSKFNIKKVVLNAVKYIELFLENNIAEWATVDGKETDFLFMVTTDETKTIVPIESEFNGNDGEKRIKRVWRAFGDDKRYDDTFNRMTDAFDID